MTDPLILVGRVAGAFGVRGELKIATYTEEPLALLRYHELKREDGTHALTLQTARAVRDGVVARALEVKDREEAETLRGLRLHVLRSALPEPDEDEFYLADLVGLRAEGPDGQALGRVKAVHNHRAGDILEIDPGEGLPTWLLPFTRDAVPEVRIGDGCVVVVRPEETEANSSEPRR